MRDNDGNVVVYIGQPWCNPVGTLVGEHNGKLIVQVGSRTKKTVNREGFTIAHITYEEYKKWKEDYHGVPKKKVVPIDRFEMMDFE